MKLFWKAIRFIGTIVLILVGLFVTANLLYVFSPYGGYDLLFLEFVCGFYYFLGENLPAISWDAGTWGPGVGAFLLATVVIHRFLKSWFTRKSRHWSLASTFCVMALLPVSFAISFIVPGVILQWELLRQVHWIEVR
ncbi:hypothetical protein JIN84_03950 [Luteolibacter yonseiensis]|uniref:Transmembrane protein n=1 Tax=Luteolibacter yonseiensis TaxID=1144680 RepID=A0A934R0Z5_9BACT|nr:hypothetical protein [Luteolibacter yonseiensis]MBK1814752.1 hypothetical protein [Luteolibacter yonseiensis]